jgi:hypothetical protein
MRVLGGRKASCQRRCSAGGPRRHLALTRVPSVPPCSNKLVVESQGAGGLAELRGKLDAAEAQKRVLFGVLKVVAKGQC